MPELPEVETTRRGIAPAIVGRRIHSLVLRSRRLRWPIPRRLPGRLAGARIQALRRRAKYLLLVTDRGTALIHLGMTGSIRLIFEDQAPKKHEHFDIVVENGPILRFHDPRRFGSLLWAGARPERHPLLSGLGPEPLGEDFHGDYLYAVSRGRRVSIKPFLMNSRIVVGIGNIYASEALFRAGIHPRRPAGRISLQRMRRLADAVRAVLNESLRSGGTTLRDFYAGDGRPGYFAQRLRVYERAEAPCPACATPIRQEVIGQRSSYFCPRCQR
ncbi:MAG: bifunctional DNA-formamidopyrimidine glycosylase/DNA-(apurinic or apyrimidinic site) lyase [Gammaproteobacteria bacterium]|nr:MAG: bifunctional DNA-formamidopyrimidine glycosylase/DNA-(apurinic or apyrimidinic site) lyase [Gammaproteobacteria bacterium]